MTVVSMIACTNDGFTGVSSRPLSADASETFNVPTYDAGSETNVLMLEYWFPGCAQGVGNNMSDNENGLIIPHPGQPAPGQDQDGRPFPEGDFGPGEELIEMTIVRN